MKKVNPFYQSKKWIKKKNKVLRKYNYECQESARFGKRVLADVVHHIYPLESYPTLALVEWNLLPLTNEKHNSFHSRKDHSITKAGRYWQRKRKKEFEEWKKNISPPSV